MATIWRYTIEINRRDNDRQFGLLELQSDLPGKSYLLQLGLAGFSLFQLVLAHFSLVQLVLARVSYVQLQLALLDLFSLGLVLFSSSQLG